MGDPLSSAPSSSPKPLHLAILVALTGLLLFVGLGDLGLTDRDEGSNAEAAREMLETGDWISPALNYEPRYAKPALVYWLISGAYSVFGVNEFTARLPSAMFGLALILLQYLFLTRLLGITIALFGSLMLLLNLEIVASSRMVLTDPELIFFTTLSAYGFWLGFYGEGRQRHWMWAFYLGMALAMLTKGPVGILIPLLGVIPYLTATRQWSRFWSRGFPILGPLVLFLIASPWYLAMFALHGADYAAAAQANTMGRFASPMEGHGGTILFFIPILLVGFFPWSGFLPFALHHALKPWKAFRTSDQSLTNDQRLAFFLALWAIGIFLFFSLSATRLPHYILPLFPAVSILTTTWWSRMSETSPAPGLKGPLSTLVVLGYLLALAFASVPAIYDYFQQDIAREFPMAAKIKPGLVPVMLGIIIFVGVTIIRHVGLTAKRQTAVFWVAGGMMLSVMLLMIFVIMPQFHRYVIAPPQELASIAGLNLGPKDHLIEFGRKRPSLIFYARRPIVHINSGEDEKFQAIREKPGRTMIILQSHLRERLPPPESEFSVLLTYQGFSLLSSEDMIKPNEER